MDYKLMNYKEILHTFDLNDLPSNIDMYYDLSYQLSTYIFDYRTKNKLSQTALAEKLGVKQAMVSKLESGSYNISLENLCSVMSKLNTKVKLNLEPFEKVKENSICKENEKKDNKLFNSEDLKDLVLAS